MKAPGGGRAPSAPIHYNNMKEVKKYGEKVW